MLMVHNIVWLLLLWTPDFNIFLSFAEEAKYYYYLAPIYHWPVVSISKRRMITKEGGIVNALCY